MLLLLASLPALIGLSYVFGIWDLNRTEFAEG